MTETDVALFDEEELMYDDIQFVKKEKDRAKKRAYVRMVTNMGGSLNLELFCEKVSYSHCVPRYLADYELFVRLQKRAITSSCLPDKASTITVPSTD